MSGSEERQGSKRSVPFFIRFLVLGHPSSCSVCFDPRCSVWNHRRCASCSSARSGIYTTYTVAGIVYRCLNIWGCSLVSKESGESDQGVRLGRIDIGLCTSWRVSEQKAIMSVHVPLYMKIAFDFASKMFATKEKPRNLRVEEKIAQEMSNIYKEILPWSGTPPFFAILDSCRPSATRRVYQSPFARTRVGNLEQTHLTSSINSTVWVCKKLKMVVN